MTTLAVQRSQRTSVASVYNSRLMMSRIIENLNSRYKVA